jgi:hypothetical protein
MPKIPYEEYYRALMAAIEARLKPFGFSRRGVNFYLGHNGNWAVVNVWRHWLNHTSRSRFTVEFGIFSHTIACCDDAVERKPPIYRCHWRRYLREPWWEILSDTDPDALANEVSTLVVEVAVPAMLPLLASDRKLAKAFGRTDGVFPEKYYQTILFKAVGDLANYKAGEKAVARAARNPRNEGYWKEKYDRLRRWHS